MTCFYDLPRPIREKVYRYALVMERIFVRPLISMEYLRNRNRAEDYGIPNLALLRVSRKINREAMPIYLRENVFSIVQVDILAAARIESQQVAKSLRQIRKLELVFDYRDYMYLARFLRSQLPAIMSEVEGRADDSLSKSAGLKSLSEMLGKFDQSSDRSLNATAGNTITGTNVSANTSTNTNTNTRSKLGLGRLLHPRHTVEQQQSQHRRNDNSSSKPTHDTHIDNMKEYLWGRTMTFVRQTFQLSHLYVDLRHCTCPLGCCRLAEEVLDWGWVHMWIHGMPNEVEVTASSTVEEVLIAMSLERQSLRPGLKPRNVYDANRAKDYNGILQYNALLKNIHEGLSGQ